MTRVFRCDITKFKNIKKTDQGFIIIPAYVTRAGVFTYMTIDGKEFKELRLPDEVFRQESLATLKNAPVTNDHPSEKVTIDNAKRLAIGWVADAAERENDYIKTNIMITDKEGVHAIDNGRRELSCGYDVDLDMTPGEWNGQKYDAIQRNIRYNHVALVDLGRAGHEVRLRLDSANFNSAAYQIDNNKEVSMVKININGKEFEVAEELAQEIETIQGSTKKAQEEKAIVEAKVIEIEGKVVEAETKASESETKVIEAQKEIDSLNGKIAGLTDALQKKDVQDKAELLSHINERVKLFTLAVKLFKEDKSYETLSNIELKKAILVKHSDKISLDGKSDDYIAARFDVLLETVLNNDKALDELANIVGSTNSKQKTSADIRLESMRKSENLWKQGRGE